MLRARRSGSPLRQAADTLREGGLVAYPTEAVWGLGCDPLNGRAVDRLLALKRRHWAKGLILIASELSQLETWIQVPSQRALRRALQTWPGPSTWVFPAMEHVPMWISGDHDSIAVRVTAHPVAAALCHAFGGALVSTSANRSGASPALTATEVRLRLGRDIDALLPGPLGKLSRPTTIREAVTGHILRR